VVGWPTNTRAEFEANVGRGVDIICTDSPSTIREWLDESR
jgi:glycerophosphoryl diester phosphodiesterase